ncbi:MAG TPA: DUF4139 domain-containing protein [Pirellulales bacterium]|nr:DUF4139 domain-containing protein [Pirellulales bacterium]
MLPIALRAVRHFAIPIATLMLALPARAADPAASPIPLKRVVLFNSGVGFFDREAEIEGDARLELKFNVDDINDLLKSMVLQDFGGGKISTVTYGSMDPITKTLKTFAIDLTSNPTLGELLGQARGESVEIDAPNAMQGAILGVEKRKRKVGDETVEAEYLNLLTDAGLRSVPLAEVGRIKLLNPQLDAELRQALAVLALGHATDKKTVTLNFLGNGKRPVHVGYVQQAPIWKTSYRLVLKDDDKPFLQGWAIVENTTEEDWQDVSLTLVSGRPISFVMNLYQPLYVPRPVVEPELFASLRPQVYGQDMAKREEEFLAQQAGAGGRGKALRRRMAAPAAPMPASGFAFGGERADASALYDLDAQRGVQSMAQAGDVGELFQYVIDTPVDLPRQQSAMLPIVNGSVEGEKVSIYNPAVQAKHPLNGLRLKNITELHLMQGPITVFDGGAYAGDARIEDLPPGSERLISYALDLDTEVSQESKPSPEQLVSVRIVNGVLESTRKYLRSQNYTIKNSGGKNKQVLVEYPHDASWKLTAPKKADETTRNLYRFAVTAEPGKPAKLEVAEEQVVSQQVALHNLDDDMIHFYLQAKVVSDQVKQALAELVRRKSEINQLTMRQQQLEQQINVIGQEQSRIRENMAQLDRKSDVYNRYVKKFGTQEDEVEKLREQIGEIKAELKTKQRALDDYLAGLDLK